MKLSGIFPQIKKNEKKTEQNQYDFLLLWTKNVSVSYLATKYANMRSHYLRLHRLTFLCGQICKCNCLSQVRANVK